MLPAGADDLEASAAQFTDALQTEHWLTLDEELGAKVLAPRGHLVDACNHSTNLMRDQLHLADLLKDVRLKKGSRLSAHIAGGCGGGGHTSK